MRTPRSRIEGLEFRLGMNPEAERRERERRLRRLIFSDPRAFDLALAYRDALAAFDGDLEAAGADPDCVAAREALSARLSELKGSPGGVSLFG